jgi:hypothetical protein
MPKKCKIQFPPTSGHEPSHCTCPASSRPSLNMEHQICTESDEFSQDSRDYEEMLRNMPVAVPLSSSDPTSSSEDFSEESDSSGNQFLCLQDWHQ